MDKLGYTKMKKINWGIISTAKIGIKKVIPAMQKGKHTTITAMSSRNLDKAQKIAETLNIPKAYGSYEQLLDDPDIEAVYIPLPNHLHVEWTLRALKAGKHVLCEKPIAVNSEEAEYLNKKVKNFPELKVMEAFMYRFHPQWQTVKKLVTQGKIGKLKNIHSIFSYYNDDPDDIRNQKDIGGGGLLDIGCYCISLSRFLLFNTEPNRVCSTIEYDPKISSLYTELLDPHTLSISFQSSLFHKDWKGVIEFRFKTEKALDFYNVLIKKGLQSGCVSNS